MNVTGITGETEIAAGWGHTCALLQGGTVMCCGHGANGDNGDGTMSQANKPVQVMGLTDATAIGADGYHACGLRQTGAVICWGYGQDGELGNGASMSSATAVGVSGLQPVQSSGAAGTTRAPSWRAGRCLRSARKRPDEPDDRPARARGRHLLGAGSNEGSPLDSVCHVT